GERVRIPDRAGVLQHAARTYHGRHVRRPGLWRQQGLRRLEARRLSGHTALLHVRRSCETTGFHPPGLHRASGAGKSQQQEGMTMAIEKTDVFIVGMGAVGGVMAAELGKAVLKVIGLERGPRLKTADFQLDELRYFQRKDLRPNPRTQPVTWRPNANAATIRLPQLDYGNQAGGGTVHYGAVSWRLHEDDFRARTQTIERYGLSAIPQDSSLADWPL